MAFTVTSFGRQRVMAVLLALAVGGLVMRLLAPNPSTLRDIGTLLLVMWLPAVGNLVAYVIRKIPHKAATPQAPPFGMAGVFTPQLRAEIETDGIAPHVAATLAPGECRCMVVKGPQAFTARLQRPLAELLGEPGQWTIALELLRPEAALPHLQAGESFHLVVGTTAVAKGRVVP